MLTDKIGIVIIEALHMLKEPAILKDIITSVASLTKLADKDIEESVQKSLEGGLRHGYILKRKNKYAAKLYASDFVSPIAAYRDLKKQQCCKHKTKPNSKNLIVKTEKVNLTQNTSNGIRTLFKPNRPMRGGSDDLSLKASMPCLSPCTKKKSPSAKPSNKSLSASIKSPANMPSKNIKKKIMS